MTKDRFQFELFRWAGVVLPVITVAVSSAIDAYVHVYQHHTGTHGSMLSSVLEACGCNSSWIYLGMFALRVLGVVGAVVLFFGLIAVGTVWGNLERKAVKSEEV